jgi:prevent-host-death family protein
MRVLPLAEAKAKLSKLISEVAELEEEITITRNGRAAAVLVSHDEFQRWKEAAEIMENPEFLAEIRKGIADLKKGRGRTLRGRNLDRLFGAPR